MPQTPFDSLMALTEAIELLDQMQTLVDDTRYCEPQNQIVQLRMDRQQRSIDERRESIRLAMLDISSRN